MKLLQGAKIILGSTILCVMLWLLLFYVHPFFIASSFIQVPGGQSRLQPHCCKVPQRPGICPRQTHQCGSCNAAVSHDQVGHLQPIAQDRLIWAALFCRWSWLFLECEASISFSDSDSGFLKVLAVRNPHPHTNGAFIAWFFSILDCLSVLNPSCNEVQIRDFGASTLKQVILRLSRLRGWTGRWVRVWRVVWIRVLAASNQGPTTTTPDAMHCNAITWMFLHVWSDSEHTCFECTETMIPGCSKNKQNSASSESESEDLPSSSLQC